MKHRVFSFILAGVGLLATCSAAAKDVYVYSQTDVLLGSTTGVKRIEFKDGTMTLVPEVGEIVDIDLSLLGYFAFKPADVGGTSSIEYNNATLSLAGDILSVTGPSEISEIRIYNALGEMTGHCVPAARSASVAVDSHGLNIVVVVAGGISQTYKIVK